MNELDIVRQLEATNSRIEKEQILLAAFMSGHRNFFIATRLALDPLVSFGVAKVPEILEDDGATGQLTFADFMDLAGQLQRRELTGHAARDAIVAAIHECDTPTWNLFYRRVLLKDLQVGVERSTINKILNKLGQSEEEALDYLIPVFGVQLALDGADEKHAKKLKGIKLVDMKLDGMRLATFLDKEAGTVTQWSRTGHENVNFPAIRAALAKLLPELPISVVLDAEIVSESFQALMTQARRKTDADTSDACLALFDIIPLDDFRKGVCSISQLKRHETLCELQTSGLLTHVAGSSIYVVPKIIVDLDTEEGQKAFHDLRAQAAALGLEGVMAKDPHAGYAGKRSEAWLKFKPTITVDLKVVRVEEGVGKFTGKLGAIVCEGIEDGKHIVVNVGSGFSDDDRIAIWNDWSLAIGQIVEIETDAITKSRDKETYGLRFPVFKRFRSAGRVPGEKD